MKSNNEVNATRLDMKLMMKRKGQGMEHMQKVMVGKMKTAMKKAGSGFLGSDSSK